MLCRRTLFASLVFLALGPAIASGQGILVNIHPDQQVRLPRPPVHYIVPVPRPPAGSYTIKQIHVEARITDQVARTQVSQSFVNTGPQAMEVCFVFPLPYDGAIDQMTLLVDGKEFPAQLLSAEEARRFYEDIVRKNRDPALLEWMGTGLFKTSVFPVPPGAERTVTLRYTQLCRSDQGVTDFLFPLSTAKYTAQAVEKVRIRVAIEAGAEIKSVYSPTHPVSVERSGRTATVTYTSSSNIPPTDFRLFYDVGKGQLSTSVLSYRPSEGEDGYFLLLATPQFQSSDEPTPNKTVVFVVDRSGSMSGEKVEQAKGALKFVLNNLRPGDLFNIVAYDSAVESFRPELQRWDDATRAAALGFVEGLYAGGSTNIDSALGVALSQLKDSSRPSYVVFLTDGLPTAGESNEMRIVQNAQKANSVRARIMAFGVGYDVNSRLLDRLVRANYGNSEYVRPNEDIEARVSALYNKIKSPVLTDVAIRFEQDHRGAEAGAVVNRMYPKQVYDLFEGEQLVIVGRYRSAGAVKVVVTGRVGDRQQTFDFPAQFVDASTDQSHGFIEKLWATRRVGDIIDELDLAGHNEELMKELVELSKKHGILTPYTSFLADETRALHTEPATQLGVVRTQLEQLDAAGGQGGFSQRAAKNAYRLADQAPAAGRAYYYEAEQDKMVRVDSVQTVGNKTFFRRDSRWIDSTISEAQEKTARRIKQFSREYFDLAAAHGKDIAQYLVFDDPVLVSIAGQAYLIEP